MVVMLTASLVVLYGGLVLGSNLARNATGLIGGEMGYQIQAGNECQILIHTQDYTFSLIFEYAHLRIDDPSNPKFNVNIRITSALFFSS